MTTTNVYILRTCDGINYATEIGTLQNSEYIKLTRIVQNIRDTASSVCHYKIKRYFPVLLGILWINNENILYLFFEKDKTA